MRNHLRQTGGAGCEKNPFGWAAIELEIYHGPNRSRARDMQPNAETAKFGRIAIAHDRIDAGICYHRGKIFIRQVRRTKGKPTHNPIQVNQRQRGRKLITSCDENRLA